MDIVQTIESDAKKVVSEVEAGLVYLKNEGAKVINWVDGNVPGAQTAIAQFVQTAEADAATLANLGAKGLSDAIATAEPELETLLANLIQATGLGKSASGELQAIEVAGIDTLKTIGQALVGKVLVTVLSKLAPAAVAAAV
jgi:hypothetical protein